MKKLGKTNGPFRYDLSQIPYDYTVEVRNRFKGLDLIDGVPEELWTEVHDIVQEAGIKLIPMKKKCKEPKWLSEEALQIAVNRREKVKSLSCVQLFVTPWTEERTRLRLFRPWDFPGKNTGVGCHAFLLGIFPTRDQTQLSHIAGGFFTV